MPVRKYQAPTMQEALQEVRRDLGQDALILATRTVRAEGLFGLFARPVVEVTASTRESDATQGAPAASRAGTERLLKKAYGAGATSRTVGEELELDRAVTPPPVSDIEGELAAIKTLVGDLFREVKYKSLAGCPETLLAAYSELREREVGEAIAARLIRHLQETLSEGEKKDRRAIHARLERIVHELVETSGPVDLSLPRRRDRRARVVSLIGPTGVGKTTTIAKLAAHFSLTEGKRVGLATIDTYRIAAAEQLDQYARMMGLPLVIVSRPSELRRALEEYSDRDVVFVDTAGRSQRDRLKMEDLKDFLQVAEPDEVHLVLAATTHVRNLLDISRRFGEVGFDRILVTKLDEAPHYGFFLDLALSVKKPVSYLTTGQEVPEHIEVATRPELVATILGREGGHGGPGR